GVDADDLGDARGGDVGPAAQEQQQPGVEEAEPDLAVGGGRRGDQPVAQPVHAGGDDGAAAAAFGRVFTHLALARRLPLAPRFQRDSGRTFLLLMHHPRHYFYSATLYTRKN